MEEDELDIEQKDDFPLRWWEWAIWGPVLVGFWGSAQVSAWVRRVLKASLRLPKLCL